MKRIWHACGVVVAVLALAIPVFVISHSGDLPRVDDAGLRLAAPPLDPGQNGADALVRASRLLVWPPGEEAFARLRELRLMRSWDPAAARELVDRNAPALAALDEALRADRLDLESGLLAEIEVEGELPHFTRWHLLARVLALRAALFASEGDGDAAFADALAVLRLAERIHAGRGAALMHASLALTLRRIGIEQVAAILPAVSPDRATARRWIAALDDTRPDAGSWHRIWAAEYRTMRRLYEWALDDGLLQGWWVPRSYLLQRNRSVQRMLELFLTLQSNSTLACAEMKPWRDPRSRGPLERAALVLGPNSVGNVLFEISAPNFGGLQRRRCALDSSHAALELLIGLRAHLAQHGVLPASLDELVPGIFEALPVDGVHGQHFRYEREARALYAPGTPVELALGF